MKKLTNKKGFTLMEMIIVIAIIVILAAISIPTLTSNLDSASEATDAANFRAAKSAAQVYAMDNEVAGATVYYDAAAGKVVTNPPAGYGECSEHKASADSADYIVIKYSDKEVPTITWSDDTIDCDGNKLSENEENIENTEEQEEPEA